MNSFPSWAAVPALPMAYVLVPIPTMVAMPVATAPLVALPVYGAPASASPTSAPTPVVPAPSKKDKEVSAKEAPKPAPGAGLPAALLELLRQDPPFTANQVFSVVPTEPVTAVEEESPAPEWYAIMRGRFVGVVDEYLLCDFATTGIARAARKVYDTQANALHAFNKALTWGGVEIL
ncbi:hypothetical protein R3P38DRAFT_2815302 [Favolaschia claudopus]|uniref:Uncharacterized protein n=1 Tax=Favolaschia claudopus TaxID=2862362 RepID=A0AAV9Z1L6_9AGAR